MKILSAIAALVLATTHVNAATITETTDFANQQTDQFLSPVDPIFDFSDVGAYSVSGNLNTTCNGSDSACTEDYSDVFSFNMGLNREIRDVFLTITNASAEFDDIFPNIFGGVLNLTAGTEGFAFTNFGGNGTFESSIVTQITEGLTHSFGISIENIASFSDTISADWNISFNVVEIRPTPAVVPLPAGGALLISGLLGMAALRRRRKIRQA